MNINSIELLKKLIKDDEQNLPWFSSKYTHKKNIPDVGGKIMDWIELSRVIHTWYSIENGDHIQSYNNYLIKLDGEVIEYTPEIVQAYITKNS